jgi:hypothetical protein
VPRCPPHSQPAHPTSVLRVEHRAAHSINQRLVMSCSSWGVAVSHTTSISLHLISCYCCLCVPLCVAMQNCNNMRPGPGEHINQCRHMTKKSIISSQRHQHQID